MKARMPHKASSVKFVTSKEGERFLSQFSSRRRTVSTIIFRSTPAMYKKEESGVKPNTVRILDSCEVSQMIEKWEELKYIRIEERGHDRSFTRELTDITEVGELLGKKIFVFSWRHGD